MRCNACNIRRAKLSSDENKSKDLHDAAWNFRKSFDIIGAAVNSEKPDARRSSMFQLQSNNKNRFLVSEDNTI